MRRSAYTPAQRHRIIEALGRDPIEFSADDEAHVEAARVRLRRWFRAKLQLALNPIVIPVRGPVKPGAVPTLSLRKEQPK